ncbi:hypothetical protein [Naasia aerilata]|uniref:Uncharacterized protein n=1 Tax=Naasia aerilata TaxID=1162966 RepID=A0ABN6XRH5_9MICO|nr:hypothetical protein [Naasia aerilata]BDZ46487.1 hypothetical protein GCM10025866_23960 [Naasia aerilata]
MDRSILLADSLALGDLITYLGRAGRVEDGSVRLIAGSGVLAVYTAILYPAGILDNGPTVLGLRTAALTDRTEFDAVVPVRSLLDRLTRAQQAATEGAAPPIAVPTEVSTVTWAGISPPRGGWKQVGSTTAGTLERAGREGIDAVANALPEGTGEQIVRRVRAEVWNTPLPDLEHVPAGAGFAAVTLGFVGAEPDETIPIYEAGAWTRLTSSRGHVVVRRRSWSLLG